MAQKIFAIESSCDESAFAFFDEEQGLTGEWVHTQIALHQKYGGVVPDLASREHMERFGPMLALISEETDFEKITEVVVTYGPGLAGCLAIGVSLAKALSMAWGVPLSGVNHLRGHVFSPFIELHADNPSEFRASLGRLLPHLGLLVSGGNTALYCIEKDLSIKIVAQTVDDAAGEALDKGAKLLGMNYPGGPLIERKGQGGNRKHFQFPRSVPESNDMRFSFSGLKTALRYRLEKMTDDALEASMSDICASYQEAVIHQLINKTKHALQHERYASLGLSGGVANNMRLREAMAQLAARKELPLYVAQPKHTGDNAGMIAFAAWLDRAGTLPSNNYDLSFASSLPLA